MNAWESGDAARARKEVVRYFRNEGYRRFFVDGGTILGLVRDMEQCHPGWRQRTVRRAEMDLHKGLRVYGREGPSLGPEFPWLLPEGPGNDDLYSLRPLRFAFAPRLALAVLYGEPLVVDLQRVFDGWWAFLSGPVGHAAFRSNLVVIQRLLAMSWAWAFLAARPETGLEDALEYEVLKLLWIDTQFLYPRLGDSYPNNHLLADRFAAWYLVQVFPEFCPADASLDAFETLWLAELGRQTYEDGTSFEHSTHYHEFACEMGAAYLLLCRATARQVPEWAEARIAKMLQFQADIAGPTGVPAAIGNATEDPLFALDVEEGSGSACLAELSRTLFGTALPWVAPDVPAVERAFWLCGGKLADSPSALPEEDRGFRAYDDGGYYFFAEANPGTRLLFRIGPAPGKPLMGGHMHADLLTLCVSVSGTPMLVDPGTYTYRQQRRRGARPKVPWREYLAGPRAHSGLAIGQRDPLGKLHGDFRDRDVPLRVAAVGRAEPGLLSWVDGGITEGGKYAGYRRGVVHVAGEYWLVYDILPSGRGRRGGSYGFQFSRHATLCSRRPGFFQVEANGQYLALAASQELSGPEVACGQMEPPAGWVSPRYGELFPGLQLRWGAAANGEATAFVLVPGSRVSSAMSVEVGRGCLAFRIGSGSHVDYLLLDGGGTRRAGEAWGLSFSGQALWFRTANGNPVAIRWLGGRALSAEAFGVMISSDRDIAALAVTAQEEGYQVETGLTDTLQVKWPQ